MAPRRPGLRPDDDIPAQSNVRLRARERVAAQCISVAGAAHSGRKPLHPNPLDLIEADFILPSIVELRRTGAGMVRHGGRVL